MYVCRKLRLCSYLLKAGFHYVEEREDRWNPKFRVWIFEMSPELMNVVNEYYASDFFQRRSEESAH